MKCYCLPSDLKRALALVKAAVPGKPRVPMLANVLLDASGDQVRIAGTDLGLGVTCTLPARVERPGALAVPFARLSKLIGDMAQGNGSGAKRKGKRGEWHKGAPEVDALLEIDAGTTTLTVSRERMRATIVGVAAQDFPLIPTHERDGGGEEATLFQVDRALLCTMIGQVICVADSRDEWASTHSPGFVPLHARLLLRVDDGKIVLSASNGGVLALCEAQTQAVGTGSYRLVLPANYLLKIASLLQQLDEPVLSVSAPTGPHPQRVLFHTSRLDMVTCLPEQIFQDFDHLVPPLQGPRVEVPRVALSTAFAFVEYVASRNGHEVELRAQADAGTLLVEAWGNHLGGQATELEVLRSVEAASFHCGPIFGPLQHLVAATGAATLSLEWHAQTDAQVGERAGTLVLRSHLSDPDCSCTYLVPRTKVIAATSQRERGV
jgi:DNA polymerase III sliding clamp (beta) subunit (PCNA family)